MSDAQKEFESPPVTLLPKLSPEGEAGYQKFRESVLHPFTEWEYKNIRGTKYEGEFLLMRGKMMVIARNLMTELHGFKKD